MGEGRGKLEVLIADLEAKKSELEKLIEEYDVMLPHLANARKALDDAGIKDTGGAAEAAAAAAAPAPAPAAAAPEASKKEEKKEAPAAEAKKEEAPAEEEAKPARRSIASLVAEDEAAGDEATH